MIKNEVCDLLRKALIEDLPLTIIYNDNQKVTGYEGIIESFHPLDDILILRDINKNTQTLFLKNILGVYNK